MWYHPSDKKKTCFDCYQQELVRLRSLLLALGALLMAPTPLVHIFPVAGLMFVVFFLFLIGTQQGCGYVFALHCHRPRNPQRNEFWDTQPAYGGAPEIWQAIRSAIEDPEMRAVILSVCHSCLFSICSWMCIPRFAGLALLSLHHDLHHRLLFLGFWDVPAVQRAPRRAEITCLGTANGPGPLFGQTEF